MMSDPISDMLTRIRNAQLAGLEKIEMPSSKVKEAIADILKREGFLFSAKVYNNKGFRFLRVGLRYDDDGKAVIREIKRISKPGRRVYASVQELPRVKNGFGIAIVSTSRGIMTDKRARKTNAGGEILCTVF